jgi:hypothetical protein
MSPRASHKLGAGCGLAYAGLLITAGSIGPAADSPPVKASPQTIGDWVVGSAPTALDWVSVYVEVVAILALVGFVVYLGQFLRRAEPDGWLPGVAVAGGLLSAIIKLGSLPAAFVAFYRAGDGLSPQIYSTLIDMNNAAFSLSWAPLALMLAAAGAVVLRTGVLPRWLGWSAGAIAVGLMASLPFYEQEMPTIMLWFLWAIAASVALLRRADVERSAFDALPTRSDRAMPEPTPF